jgi:hypothetical protein
VARAIKPDYKHVTSTRTLIQLAKAIGVPAPLDLVPVGASVPSAEILARIFSEIFARLVPDQDFSPKLFAAMGQALRQTLLEMAENPESANDPDHVTMAARISARQVARADKKPTAPESD